MPLTVKRKVMGVVAVVTVAVTVAVPAPVAARAETAYLPVVPK
jgi:hypothetical protein